MISFVTRTYTTASSTTAEMRTILRSSGIFKARFAASCRSLCMAAIACTMFACAPPGSTTPDRWHHDGWRPTPYIITSWSGVTAERVVFGFNDAEPFEVAVLERVDGPDPSEMQSVRGKAVRTKRDDRVEYLANANGKLLSAEDVPPGLRVEVNGFLRAAPASGKIYNPRAKKYEIAQPKPFDYSPSRFSMIKVDRVFVIEADGKRRLLWRSDVPFRDL